MTRDNGTNKRKMKSYISNKKNLIFIIIYNVI